MNYGIFTGWYADHQARPYPSYGDEFVRSVDCYYLWQHCVSRYTRPESTLVINSNSPLVPRWDEAARVLDLDQNFGHAVKNQNHLSGVSRTWLLGLLYAFANNYDYGVCVEQGCLLYGDGFIETFLEAGAGAELIIPTGTGTPRPVQTSLFAVSRRAIPEFVFRYSSFGQGDNALSPERKMARVASKMSSAIVPTGPGRARPVDFTAPHFFMKHGSREEIRTFANLVRYDSLPF
jgi:hypothetical protein